MKHTRLAAAFAVAFSIAFAADGAQAQQPAPPASIAGEYTLAQIDEAELPVLISEEDGCRVEMTGATLTLAAENRWTLDAQLRKTCGEDVAEKTARQTGTFTAEQQALRFSAQPAEEVAAADEQASVIQIQAVTAGTLAQDAIQVTIGEAENKRTLVFRR